MGTSLIRSIFWTKRFPISTKGIIGTLLKNCKIEFFQPNIGLSTYKNAFKFSLNYFAHEYLNIYTEIWYIKKKQIVTVYALITFFDIRKFYNRKMFINMN